MTNYNFYKKEALRYLAGVQFLIRQFRRTTGYEGDLFGEEFKEWLKSEYHETIKLTQFEFDFLKRAQKKGFSWIARNEDNKIYLIAQIINGKSVGVYTTFLENDFLFISSGPGEDSYLKIDDILVNYEIVSTKEV